jgi:hypothetical protein
VLSPSQLALIQNTKDIIYSPSDVPWKNNTEGTDWRYPPATEYVWKNREESAGGIPETLTQQYLRLDVDHGSDDRWGGPGWGDWNVKTSLAGRRTESPSGFGYYEPLYSADDSGLPLREPVGIAPRAGETVTMYLKVRPLATSAKPGTCGSRLLQVTSIPTTTAPRSTLSINTSARKALRRPRCPTRR